jgi:hypothetical protein
MNGMGSSAGGVPPGTPQQVGKPDITASGDRRVMISIIQYISNRMNDDQYQDPIYIYYIIYILLYILYMLYIYYIIYFIQWVIPTIGNSSRMVISRSNTSSNR